MKRVVAASALSLLLSVPSWGAFAAASSNPDAQAAKVKGDQLAEKDDTEGAVKAYREALAKDPKFVDAATALGEAYFGAERFNEAVTAFEQALSMNPSDPAVRYNLAYSLRKAGRFQEAIQHYRAYAQAKPSDPDGYYGLAESEVAAGQKTQALASYRKYIELEKRPSEAEWVGKAKEAADKLDKELAQHAPPATTNVATASPNNGTPAPAPAPTATAQPAPAPAPTTTAQPAPAPRTNSTQQPAPAPAQQTPPPPQQVAALNAPGVDPVAIQRQVRQSIADGDAYMGAKSFVKAQVSYRTAVNLDPQSEEGFFKLGLSYAMSNDYSGAASAFERCLALNPRNTSARQNLERARAKMATGGAPSGVDAAESSYNKGVVAMQQKDYVAALAAFDEALRARQDFALAYVARGTAFVALNDPRRALQEYSKALTFDASLSSPYFGMAEAYRQGGDKQRALQYYSRYVQSNGRDKDAATTERANRWIAELSR